MYKAILVSMMCFSSVLATESRHQHHRPHEQGVESGSNTTNVSNSFSNSTTSSSTSGLVSVSTQQANAAPCDKHNQTGSLDSSPGDQLVTIVQVGDAAGTQLRYFPDNVVAPVGSIVQFQFHPKNHTITESSFDNPCVPLAANATTPQRPGLKSGFVPVTTADTDMKVYNMLVNDTKPIWLYCGQQPHCQKGMVMVINQNPADAQKTLENFRAAAMVVPIPGAPTVSAALSGTSIGVTSSTVASLPPIVTTTSSTVTAIAASASQSSSTKPSPVQESTGSGNGLPAVFTGAAMPRAQPFQIAGFGGVALAGVVAFL